MKIQLDGAALLALFPEGSEGYVKLQNAVIDQMVYRVAQKDFNGKAAEQVRRVTQEAALEVFESSRPGLIATTKKRLDEVFRVEATGAVQKVLSTSGFWEKYQRELEYARNTQLSQEVKDFIEARVNKAFQNVSISVNSK